MGRRVGEDVNVAELCGGGMSHVGGCVGGGVGEMRVAVVEVGKGAGCDGRGCVEGDGEIGSGSY